MGFGAPDYLERRGAVLDAWVRFHLPEGGRRLLEIGGAGLPAADFVRGFAERHAADPLLARYARLFPRPAEGIAARAEELPFPRDHFDAVLCLNVLDHVDDPPRALAEAARVLRPGGALFLSCDTYAQGWLVLRAARVRLLGERNNDVLHPHHFTPRSLLALLPPELAAVEVCRRERDPLAGERPFALEGWRGRLPRRGRLYVAARRR